MIISLVRNGDKTMLSDTGYRVDALEGINARAKDATGNIVNVSASHEAILDFGWSAIFIAASRKYAADQTVPNSKPPKVRVTT
jgi:hypothetical protein